jgi:hypothetical protein
VVAVAVDLGLELLEMLEMLEPLTLVILGRTPTLILVQELLFHQQHHIQ